MARQVKVPKPGEGWILKSELGEIDFQVTQVTQSATSMDSHPMLHIEGMVLRQRMNDMASMNSITFVPSGYSVGSSSPYATFGMVGSVKMKNPYNTSKGMAVDIRTIETVDGFKAQIALTVGTKTVIAWESEAFEDDADLDAKGAQTGEVKAKKAAEAHAKDVLKRTFK